MTEPGEAIAERDLSGHPGVAAVLSTLAAHHVQPQVRFLPDAVRTARAAADALGITPAEIANSLVFAGRAHDGSTEPVLVLASGGHRVDQDRVAGLLDLAALEKATPEQVRDRAQPLGLRDDLRRAAAHHERQVDRGDLTLTASPTAGMR